MPSSLRSLLIGLGASPALAAPSLAQASPALAQQPGVGALATKIWRDQANEIRAKELWRKARYPQTPVYPVALAPGGDPDRQRGHQGAIGDSGSSPMNRRPAVGMAH